MNVRNLMITIVTVTCVCLLSCDPAEKTASAVSQPAPPPGSSRTPPAPASNGTEAPVDSAQMTPEQIAAEEINRAGEAAEAEAMRIAAEGLPPNAIDDSEAKPRATTKK